MKALLLALKGKGGGAPMPQGDEEPSPDSEPKDDNSGDYKQLAKDAAKDGDWDAMIDALCQYIDQDKG